MPVVTATSVTITATSIGGSSVAKTFNAVSELTYDFVKGMVKIVDTTGTFYFSYTALTTITHVIAGGSVTITLT